MARELGADCLATGHYVRRTEDDATGPQLLRACDPARDQSYFLYATTEAQLDFLRFPLGGLPKSEVRRIADSAGLRVAAKPDSQDICFVPDGDYAAVVRKIRPEADAPGDIVHAETGAVLGRTGPAALCHRYRCAAAPRPGRAQASAGGSRRPHY
jgi:tRNA-specific 2-thiouridylase